MPKYFYIEIEGRVSKTYYITAEDEEEAKEKARDDFVEELGGYDIEVTVCDEETE